MKKREREREKRSYSTIQINTWKRNKKKKNSFFFSLFLSCDNILFFFFLMRNLNYWLSFEIINFENKNSI